MKSDKELVKDRLKICAKCPEVLKGMICKKCGCFIPAKVRLKRAKCPIGKW